MAARAASSRLGVAPPPSSSSSSSLRRARRPLSPRAARLVCSNTVGAGQVAHFAAAAGSQSGLSSSPWLGPALFFAPGAALALYSLIRGKGNLKDGFSRVLTEVSQGYFQVGEERERGGRNVELQLSAVARARGVFRCCFCRAEQPAAGGENIPEVDGDLSDLVGDEPLFVALYKWFRTYGGVYRLAFGPKAFLVVSDPVTARLSVNGYCVVCGFRGLERERGGGEKEKESCAGRLTDMCFATRGSITIKECLRRYSSRSW